MNVFEKLQTCRVELAKSKLTKSGVNNFSHYSYFELGDFMPRVNELLLEHKLCSSLMYDVEQATLTLFDAEEPTSVMLFTCPMSTADLTATHAVQNLGAVMTYLRRYLWTNAMEIVESDTVDAGTAANPNTKAPQRAAQPQQAQGQGSDATCKDCGKEVTGYTTKAGKEYDAASVLRFAMKDFGEPVCNSCGYKRKHPPAEQNAPMQPLVDAIHSKFPGSEEVAPPLTDEWDDT